MALTRKNLMVDGEQLAALAARRGTSESAAVREAVENALLAEEFDAAMERLQVSGYGTNMVVDDAEAPVIREEDSPPKRRRRQ